MQNFPKDKFRKFLNPEEKSEIIDSNVLENLLENLEEPKTITEKEEFESLKLSNDDLLEIKKIALAEILETDLSISELIDLVLLSKANKNVKEKNRDNLLIREFIEKDGKITKKGKFYLESDETKDRLKSLIK